jgi:hypothetical protein
MAEKAKQTGHERKDGHSLRTNNNQDGRPSGKDGSHMDAWREGNKASLNKTAVCLEGKKPAPVDMAKVTAHLENSKGATREETVWATYD